MFYTIPLFGHNFDLKPCIIGWLCGDKAEEPQPDTISFLRAISQARQNVNPILVCFFRGVWCQIEDYYPKSDIYLLAQLDTSRPVFQSDLTGTWTYYRGEITKDKLILEMSCVFLFNPMFLTMEGGCRP